jgi:integrase
MAIERLTPKDIKEARPKPGGKVNTLNDGGGLNLEVTPGKYGPRQYFFFRFRFRGNPEQRMGIGPAHDYTLEEAREIAREARKLIRRGINPLSAKRSQAASQRAAEANAASFDAKAEEYLRVHEGSWKNAIHRQQWHQSLRDYVNPILGHMEVGEITTDDVLKVLLPIWSRKPETASRVRQRIETVLDFAGRNGTNPAKWEGVLEHKLPKRNKRREVENFAALPWSDMPAFMRELRAIDGVVARALEFLTLTAARTGEILSARWSEIDWKARLRTIPKQRVKNDAGHLVPLSDAAIAVLRTMEAQRRGDRIFPGLNKDSTRNLLLELRPRELATVHGMRGAFKSWSGACTNTPKDIAEMCLGHLLESDTERAYMHEQLLAKRRQLLDNWARFCAGKEVVEFPG